MSIPSSHAAISFKSELQKLDVLSKALKADGKVLYRDLTVHDIPTDLEMVLFSIITLGRRN